MAKGKSAELKNDISKYLMREVIYRSYINSIFSKELPDGLARLPLYRVAFKLVIVYVLRGEQ